METVLPFAEATLESGQIQDLGEIISEVLKITAQYNIPIRFRLRVEVGEGSKKPGKAAVEELNKILGEIDEGLRVK